jgi:hypothetical protein
MAGPIRSLDDLARKGFDLNVTCPCGKYDRTIAITEVRRLFRLLRRSEDWSGAHRRWRCSWLRSALSDRRPASLSIADARRAGNAARGCWQGIPRAGQHRGGAGRAGPVRAPDRPAGG